jgi:membrane-bound lytic murein transglycosylase B
MTKRKGGIHMATRQRPVPLSAEELLDAVQQLSPAELHDFKRQFTAWERQNGKKAEDEGVLVRAAKARLSTAERQRLRRLTAKSEQGSLTPKELAQYRVLARRAERLNAARAEALAELVRRRGQPARVVMAEIGWEGSADGT